VLAAGSPTSHASVLARTSGIPLVVGAGAAALHVRPGTELGVDGGTGEIDVAPDEARLRDLAVRAARSARARADALRAAAAPAVTREGTPVAVGANIGSVDDARSALVSGADFAGLVRTEFLFLDRETAPDVEEQVFAYLALADAMHGRRLTLRTLDVGGDKPLPHLPSPPSNNPFLGVRGLRLSLARPELFRDQLRAIVRTARQTPVSVMFPMVSALSELSQARRLLDQVAASEGGMPAGLEVGIMVEVPAVAHKAAALAPHVDFFSIGTNDLTQYSLAAERGNPDLAMIGDAFDPGVLALIRAVCVAADAAIDEPHVAVCGDLAGDPRAAALLVGLGVRTLSVAAPAVPLVKQAVRAIDLIHAEDVAATALVLPGPDEVRALLEPN
jgi:phosphocarrier protein FPr